MFGACGENTGWGRGLRHRSGARGLPMRQQDACARDDSAGRERRRRSVWHREGAGRRRTGRDRLATSLRPLPGRGGALQRRRRRQPARPSGFRARRFRADSFRLLDLCGLRAQLRPHRERRPVLGRHSRRAARSRCYRCAGAAERDPRAPAGGRDRVRAIAHVQPPRGRYGALLGQERAGSARRRNRGIQLHPGRGVGGSPGHAARRGRRTHLRARRWRWCVVLGGQ